MNEHVVVLSASEEHNVERYGETVAERVVATYSIAASARAQDETLVCAIEDVRLVPVERVVQLSGALIDAGADRLVYHDVDDPTALRVALTTARITDSRIEIR